MPHSPKQSHYVRCPVFELLFNSLCDPLTKMFGDPALHKRIRSISAQHLISTNHNEAVSDPQTHPTIRTVGDDVRLTVDSDCQWRGFANRASADVWLNVSALNNISFRHFIWNTNCQGGNAHVLYSQHVINTLRNLNTKSSSLTNLFQSFPSYSVCQIRRWQFNLETCTSLYSISASSCFHFLHCSHIVHFTLVYITFEITFESHWSQTSPRHFRKSTQQIAS